MFEKFTLYRFACPAMDGETLAEQLSALAFVPTSATQDMAFGFVPPREEHGAMVENIGGELIAKLLIERRSVPAVALRKRVEAEAEKVEAATGRKPGKKERRALKEDALLALLPQAFEKQASVPIWIDRAGGFMVVGATTSTALDLVVTALVRAVPDLMLHMVQTALTPTSFMAGMLLDGEDRGEFSLGRECDLRASDEQKSGVRFTHHNLSTGEIRKHITEGKMPRRLALQWKDRISFRMSDSMAVDKVDFLEGCFGQGDSEGVDAFDADIAIYTGELRSMLADLLAELGGEIEFGKEQPEPVAPHDGSGDEPLFIQARNLVCKPDGKASISYVQRCLSIGYNQAARLLEELELSGWVSAMGTTGQRTVLKHIGGE